MSLVFNMVGGAGGSAELPAIYATYPEGSVCTCSNGAKTYTAKDTSGFWLFAGLDIGTWTVTATDGSDPASKTIAITENGQIANIVLEYTQWYFKDGEQYESITGGWSNSGWSYNGRTAQAPTITDRIIVNSQPNQNATIAGTAKKIDFTGINTIKVNVIAVTTAVRVDLSQSKALASSGGDEVVRQAITQVGVHNIDVSSVNGEYYLSVSAISNSTTAWVGTVTEIWGET